VKAEGERENVWVWLGLGASPEPVPRLVQFPLLGEPLGALGGGVGSGGGWRGGLRCFEAQTCVSSGFPAQAKVFDQR
jgi:hypothetical protein